MLTRTRALIILAVSFLLIIYGSYNALTFEDKSFEGFSDDYSMNKVYRSVFFHVPLAAVMFIAFIVTFFASILYLKTRDLKWDYIASSSVKLGIVFGTFTLITGSVWAKSAWGDYWNWDPRETAVLVLWFIYAAYLSIRSAVSEENQKARLCSVMGIFGIVGLILTWISSSTGLHPDRGSLELESLQGMTLGLMITGHILVYIYLMWQDLKIREIERHYDDRLSRNN